MNCTYFKVDGRPIINLFKSIITEDRLEKCTSKISESGQKDFPEIPVCFSIFAYEGLGKSFFLNRILGFNVLPSEKSGDRQSTDHVTPFPVEVCYSEHPYFEVVSCDDSRSTSEILPPEEPVAASASGVATSTDFLVTTANTYREHVMKIGKDADGDNTFLRVKIGWPSLTLKANNMSIIDLPGYDQSKEVKTKRRNERTSKALKKIDVLGIQLGTRGKIQSGILEGLEQCNWLKDRENTSVPVLVGISFRNALMKSTLEETQRVFFASLYQFYNVQVPAGLTFYDREIDPVSDDELPLDPDAFEDLARAGNIFYISIPQMAEMPTGSHIDIMAALNTEWEMCTAAFRKHRSRTAQNMVREMCKGLKSPILEVKKKLKEYGKTVAQTDLGNAESALSLVCDTVKSEPIFSDDIRSQWTESGPATQDYINFLETFFESVLVTRINFTIVTEFWEPDGGHRNFDYKSKRKLAKDDILLLRNDRRCILRMLHLICKENLNSGQCEPLPTQLHPLREHFAKEINFKSWSSIINSMHDCARTKLDDLKDDECTGDVLKDKIEAWDEFNTSALSKKNAFVKYHDVNKFFQDLDKKFRKCTKASADADAGKTAVTRQLPSPVWSTSNKRLKMPEHPVETVQNAFKRHYIAGNDPFLKNKVRLTEISHRGSGTFTIQHTPDVNGDSTHGGTDTLLELSMGLDKGATEVKLSGPQGRLEQFQEIASKLCVEVTQGLDHRTPQIGPLYPIFITTKERSAPAKVRHDHVPNFHIKDLQKSGVNFLVVVVLDKTSSTGRTGSHLTGLSRSVVALRDQAVHVQKDRIVLVSLEDSDLGIGRIRTMIMKMAKWLELPFYFLLDDDLEFLEYKNSFHRFGKTNSARALSFMQLCMHYQLYNTSPEDPSQEIRLQTFNEMMVQFLAKEEERDLFFDTWRDLDRGLLSKDKIKETAMNVGPLLDVLRKVSIPNFSQRLKDHLHKHSKNIAELSADQQKVYKLMGKDYANIPETVVETAKIMIGVSRCGQVSTKSMRAQGLEQAIRQLCKVGGVTHGISLTRYQAVLMNASITSELQVVSDGVLFQKPKEHKEKVKLVQKLARDQTLKFTGIGKTAAQDGYKFSDSYFTRALLRIGVGGCQTWAFTHQDVLTSSAVNSTNSIVESDSE